MNLALVLGEKPQIQARTQLLRWAPTLCALLAGFWLAWSAVHLLWSFFSEPELQNAPIPRPTSAAQTPTANVGASLASYHLFGQTPAGELPNAPDAPETQLKLLLIGTAAGRDPKTGVAMIADEDGKQRQYQVGEIIGAATVDSVYADRVVLLYQGRLETLRLVNSSTAKSLESKPRSELGQFQFDAPGSVNAAAIGQDPNAYVNPVGVGSTASFDAVREQVMANPAAIAGMLAPVFDANGNLDGVKIAAGANEPLLNQAGIRPDDIIVSVNGTRIDSITRGQQIAENLAVANQAVIIVRREGREITLPAVRFR